jgi:hypothetical protein
VYQFELDGIAKRAAERIKQSDGSHSSFLKITSEEVAKSGIKNTDDLKRNTKKIRGMLTAHSAAARTKRASAQRVSKRIRDRMSQ